MSQKDECGRLDLLAQRTWSAFITTFNDLEFFITHQWTITLKMMHQGRSNFNLVFTMDLCTLELKANFDKFPI